MAQWYPEKKDATLEAVARSLVAVFPFVQVYKSVSGQGYHFLASNSPIVMPAPEEIAQAMPIAAQKDLMEWNNYNQPDILSYVKKIVNGREDINDLLNEDKNIKITDDQPYNEYFFWRETN